MKRVMTLFVITVICMVQQGCYTTVDRKGQYFASTKELWKKRQSGPGAWFPELRTAGDGMYLAGCFIPVVGWVTLCPAGLVLDGVERLVIAPVFDTVCLPVDCINNVSYRIDEEHYKVFEGRLDSDLDVVLADSMYWIDRTEEKFRYLRRWLSQKGDNVDLTSKRVSAILSFLAWYAKERVCLDDQMMSIYHEIVRIIYYDKSCEQESLTALANWFVEIKNATKVYVDEFFNAEIYLCREDWVKFNDEQLMVLRDADIKRSEITRVLKIRQEKREKEVNLQKAN